MYAYDGVNRLTLAQAQGAGSSFYLNYGYTADGSTGRYGNMTCVTNAQTNGLCPNYTFTPATNQIVGYGYDAAGNTSSDGTFQYQWDAEGHLLESLQSSTVLHAYTYNALGQRAQDIPGGGLTTQELFTIPPGNCWAATSTTHPSPAGGISRYRLWDES